MNFINIIIIIIWTKIYFFRQRKLFSKLLFFTLGLLTWASCYIVDLSPDQLTANFRVYLGPTSNAGALLSNAGPKLDTGLTCWSFQLQLSKFPLAQ